MLLSSALRRARLNGVRGDRVTRRLQAGWAGARLYVSRTAVRNRRIGLAPAGAAERFLSDLRGAIEADMAAQGRSTSRGLASLVARDAYDDVALMLSGHRVDVDGLGPRTG